MLNVTFEGCWLEHGEGMPVVFLHGLAGSAGDWEPTLEIVSDGARAIAPALPLSQAAGEASVAALSDWVAGFLDRLGVDRAVFAGHALGAHVAADAALRYEDRAAGLVLAGCAPLVEPRFAHGPASVALDRRLSSTRVPTLLVWGEDDDVTPLAVAARLHQHIRDSTMFVLRGCGHVPMVEHPYAFGRVVRAWLEETASVEPAVRASS
jgi:pimeloyl-ACP methyl ester carboxylesterase